MSRAPKTAAAPKPSQTTAVANWDEQLARDAEIAAGMEANAGGAANFAIKGGILAFNEQPLPNNQMAVVILDSILENTFYEDAYDPDNITPPTCFALGRDDATLAPHENVVEKDQAQSEKCATCPMNQFGTAEKGRGKACGNRRRLMVIPAGNLDANGTFEAFDEEEHFTNAVAGMLKLPPTSVKGYANFVKQVAGSLRRPPHGIFTKIQVVPDPKTQFKVTFSPLAQVPNELLQVVMKRREDVKPMIEMPYNLDVEETPQQAPQGRGGRGKPAANKRPEVKRGSGKKY